MKLKALFWVGWLVCFVCISCVGRAFIANLWNFFIARSVYSVLLSRNLFLSKSFAGSRGG